MPAEAVGAVTSLRSLAERAANSLARYEDVAAVALLGSVARGNASPDSDVDLLVITYGTTRPSRLTRRLPPALRHERLSLLCFSIERWQEEVERGALFLHHVRLEGEALHDPQGIVSTGLAAVAERPPDVAGELLRQRRHLRLYRDLTRLNGHHLFALAHLYAIGKAAAIARCTELGQPTFVKEEALQSLAARQPKLADAAETLARLRPFYDVTRGRRAAPLPFEPVDADDEVRRGVVAIEQLVGD
jgi:predicted nucleotidyltransferase